MKLTLLIITTVFSVLGVAQQPGNGHKTTGQGGETKSSLCFKNDLSVAEVEAAPVINNEPLTALTSGLSVLSIPTTEAVIPTHFAGDHIEVARGANPPATNINAAPVVKEELAFPTTRDVSVLLISTTLARVVRDNCQRCKDMERTCNKTICHQFPGGCGPACYTATCLQTECRNKCGYNC